MPTYGISSTGLEIKRLADIKTELETSFKTQFGTAHNIDSRSPSGQLIGILAEREALLWELIEQLYNAQYPDSAEGIPLDNVVSITGTIRKPATKSTAVITIFGTLGTVIPAGSIVSVQGNSTARFVLDTQVTIAAGSPNQINGNFTAETAGALQALSGTLTVIDTPISGWTTCTNALDAVVGQNEETDSELKIRRIQELSLAGKSTFEAIKSSLSAIDNVNAVVLFTNNSNIVDGEGRAPHTIDAVVEGGINQDIAQTLFDTIGAGLETIGDITVNITDSQNFTHPIKFSRPDEIEIWIEIDLTTDATFPVDGVTQVRNAILAYGLNLLIGEDVIVYPKLMSSFSSIIGITDVAIRVGIAVDPTLDNNIVISARQKAVFDSSRLTVVEL
jgi:uncharacterized phage protein gp47/JayE